MLFSALLVASSAIAAELLGPVTTLKALAATFAARTAGFGLTVVVGRLGLDGQFLIAFNFFVLAIAAAAP